MNKTFAELEASTETLPKEFRFNMTEQLTVQKYSFSGHSILIQILSRFTLQVALMSAHKIKHSGIQSNSDNQREGFRKKIRILRHKTL